MTPLDVATMAETESSGAIIPFNLSSNGHAAADLAALGLCVFPCRKSGKAPLTGSGLNDATNDTETVAQWWSRWPDAMIGVRTGPESGLWVLDVDVDEEKGVNGFPALAELEAAYGALPMTVRSRTPRGGMHYWLRWSEGVRNSASKVAPGIDLRGRGGYVIVPPSARADRRSYTWEDPPALFELAELPGWLLEAVTKRPEPEPDFRARSLAEPSRYAEVALVEECAAVVRAPNGARNDTLNRAAFSLGTLVAGGVLEEAACGVRLAEAGQGAGLRRDEILRTIESGLAGGGQYPPGPERQERGPVREEGGRRHQPRRGEGVGAGRSGRHRTAGDRAPLARRRGSSRGRAWLVRDLIPEKRKGLLSGQWAPGRRSEPLT